MKPSRSDGLPEYRGHSLPLVSFVSELREVVRKHGFRQLYLTRLSAQLGDGVFQAALASYVLFDPTKKATASEMALTFAVLMLPYSIVGPFAGVFLDRWRRRQVLVYSNLVRVAATGWVAVLVAVHEHRLVFYASALAALSVNRFFLATLSAALPHVVPARDLVMANSVATTSGTVAAGLGGTLGFVTHAISGQGPLARSSLLLVSASVYLVSALVARTMGKDTLGPDFDPNLPQTREALSRVARGLTDGAQHVWHHRVASHALTAIAFHRFFQGLALISTLLLYRNYFHNSADTGSGLKGLGLVAAATGIGVLVAATLTPEITPHKLSTPAWLLICLTSSAMTQLVFGLPFTEPMIVMGAFFISVAAQSAKICVDTLVQSAIEDAYRGRVFSLYDVLFNVSFVAAAATAALIFPTNGKSYLGLGVVVVGYTLTAAGYSVVCRRTGVNQVPAPSASL